MRSFKLPCLPRSIVKLDVGCPAIGRARGVANLSRVSRDPTTARVGCYNPRRRERATAAEPARSAPVAPPPLEWDMSSSSSDNRPPSPHERDKDRRGDDRRTPTGKDERSAHGEKTSGSAPSRDLASKDITPLLKGWDYEPGT